MGEMSRPNRSRACHKLEALLVEIRAQRFEVDVRSNVTEFHDHKRGDSFQKLLELDAFCNY